MIEKLMILIIQDLGPTGLLICGLYWILGRHLKEISAHIKTINEEINKNNSILEQIHTAIKTHKER